MNITDKLIDKIVELNNASVVGLDPTEGMIPEHLKPLGMPEAIWAFNKGLIDALFDIVPAVKPQIAMYEVYGAEGLGVYLKTIRYAKEKGLIVIADIKRGDIASTAEAYSTAHLRQTGADFVTLNPYMGRDAIDPFLADCKALNKGVFVLVKTSNKSSGDLQDLRLESGETVYERVGKMVGEWGADYVGERGYSSVGAVVGATYPAQAAELRRIMPSVFFLVPGYGAQGGSAKDVAVCFDKNGLGAVVNSARGIIAAYKSEKYKADGGDFAEAARQAAIDMRDDINGERFNRV